jgi:acyl transferase domain-containing protein
MSWPTTGPRRISVNSFGFGGTNAHIILDDAHHYLQAHHIQGNHCTFPYPLPVSEGHSIKSDKSGNRALTLDVDREAASSECAQLLVWSAADKKALNRTIKHYTPYYREQILGDQTMLEKLAFTLSARRSNLLWRSFSVVDPTQENEKMADLPVSQPYKSSRTGLCYVFTGQGADYAKMGMELLKYPVFREMIQRMHNVFAQLGCPWSLLGTQSVSISLNICID